jgi:hypothetical protein
MGKPLARLTGWVCAFALTLLGCGEDSLAPPSASSGGVGSGGSGNAPGGGSSVAGASPGTALSWSAEGFVAKESNPFLIEGAFYAYSDCDPPSGLPCTAPDASLTGPDGKPGWLVDATRACIKGTAVQVANMMYAAQWGAGLALDLASAPGDPGAPAPKAPFNLQTAKIRGFSVDITGTAPGRIRINLTMPGLTDSSFVDAVVPGTTTFSLADAKQGSFVKTKTPLDPTRVEALQLQVFTNAGAPTPYDFCVSAIRVLTDDTPGALDASTGGP